MRSKAVSLQSAYGLNVFSIIGITSLSKYPRYPFVRESPRGTPLIISWFWISKVLSYRSVTKTAAWEWVCIQAPAFRVLRMLKTNMEVCTCKRRGIVACRLTVSSWEECANTFRWKAIGQTCFQASISIIRISGGIREPLSGPRLGRYRYDPCYQYQGNRWNYSCRIVIPPPVPVTQPLPLS